MCFGGIETEEGVLEAEWDWSMLWNMSHDGCFHWVMSNVSDLHLEKWGI